MKSIPRRFGFKAAALATAVSGALALLSVPAGAAGLDAGIPYIVNPATNQPLPGGESTTVWSWKLPTPPASNCSGDSATKGFFVYSYITPVANDPYALTFRPSDGPVSPAGSFAFPLFDISGSPYISRTTAPNTGQVKDFPAVQFTFARFSVDGRNETIPLPAGDYNIGIACWDGNNRLTDKMWNTRVRFTANSTDPSGEVWAAIPFAAPSAPQNLTAASGGLDANGLFAVNLAWQAPASDGGKSVSSYQVFRGTAPGTGRLLATVPATRTSFVDGGHVPDVTTRFYYTVKAVNQIGASAASNEASAKASPWNLVPVG